MSINSKGNAPATTFFKSGSQFLSIIFILYSFSFGNNAISQAWDLLLANEPLEAKKIFTQNINHNDNKIAGQAYRGLAITAKFLGQYDSTMAYLFQSFLVDTDTLLFSAGWTNIISFGRTWQGHLLKDGYTVMKMLTKTPQLLGGEWYSMLADRYINDGKLTKARKLLKNSGIIRNFQMIGPFDNISGSGYKKKYPPERGIDFSRKYIGKDGAEITWFPFYNNNPNGWLFTEFNYSAANAILYYYTNIQSALEQMVNINFGASGSFKIFLNDNLVLADSIFRNTGTDMFTQKVKLFKGDNKLLIKLGHESKYANFLVRFTDDQGQGLNTISYTENPGKFKKDTIKYTNLTNSPFTRTIEQGLLKRLQIHPRDPEASIFLMDFYNITELTDKGQQLARTFLQHYPQSSLWHDLYSESMQRSKKITESQTALKTAYRLCKYNYHAWQNTLQILANSANYKNVIDFINKSYREFKNSPEALLYQFGYYSQTENETMILKVIEELENKYYYVDMAVYLITNFYMERGNSNKAEKITRQYLKWQRTSTEVYSVLADIYLKMGQRKKAIKTYLESLKFAPASTGFYYFLAKLALQHKEYASARNYIEQALTIAPTSSSIISLKGIILKALGKRSEAIQAFEEAIGYTYNYFDAWDQLLPLQGKPELTTITKLPDPKKLRKEAHSWNHMNNEKGAILAYYKDVFLYPSRCSREREYLVVHLPSQNAIDLWKEYSIDFNQYYQIVNITQAYSINAGETETPADVNRNMVVFKSLQPGDDIVLEWTVENYYTQGMAKQVWGDHSFSLPFPVYKTELRLTTPSNDTIPYMVKGNAIEVKSQTIDIFRTISFIKSSYNNPPKDSYFLIDPLGEDKVFYSTFTSWAEIAQWYANLTENKIESTYEIKRIVDSLTAGISSSALKVMKIHEYITNTIRYSFIPFRQSAWIPQPANEVMATKIGDCKDMSSLGKSLLDYAGIKSNLVLVNTRDRNSIYPTYIGPNFNHCILSYELDSKHHYLDLTDNNTSINSLPRMDQGALALIIDTDVDSLINLPLDNSEKRKIIRTITSTLGQEGNLNRQVEVMKSGVFASDMRSSYRFLSAEEQNKRLQKVLVKSFPNITIDTLTFFAIDNLTDTLNYLYRYTAQDAAQISTNTALLALNLPDIITGESYPSEEKRSYAIDMTRTWFAIGTYQINGKLTIPDDWRLISTPEPTSLSGQWGKYYLAITQEGNTINYTREATFNFDQPIEVEESEEIRSLLAKIVQADNIQLMFYRN